MGLHQIEKLFGNQYQWKQMKKRTTINQQKLHPFEKTDFLNLFNNHKLFAFLKLNAKVTMTFRSSFGPSWPNQTISFTNRSGHYASAVGWGLWVGPSAAQPFIGNLEFYEWIQKLPLNWLRWRLWHHRPPTPSQPLRGCFNFIQKIQGFLWMAKQQSAQLNFAPGTGW